MRTCDNLITISLRIYVAKDTPYTNVTYTPYVINFIMFSETGVG